MLVKARLLGFVNSSYRICHNFCVGPFASLADFYCQYFGQLDPDAPPTTHAPAKRTHSTPHRICFTHAQHASSHLLYARTACLIASALRTETCRLKNIVLDDDFKPVGLINW
jgi:hypothetical protein